MSGENVIRAAVEGAQEHIWDEPDWHVIESRRKPPPFPLETLGGWREWIRIPFLSISVIGGIQPDKLVKLLMSGDDDGLASRFLMSWPDPILPKRPSQVPNDSLALRAMKRLHDLRMGSDDEGNPEPVIVRLSNEAASMLDRWRLENAEHQEWASGLYLSHLGKMPGMVLRLSIVLEYMEWALSPEGTQEPETVSAKAFASAAGLVEEYFLPMAERAYGDAALPKVERDAALLARQIRHRRVEKINTREIQREWKLPGLNNSQAIHDACNHLAEANWLDPAPSRAGSTSGRSKADFLVNPKVWRS